MAKSAKRRLQKSLIYR